MSKIIRGTNMENKKLMLIFAAIAGFGISGQTFGSKPTQDDKDADAVFAEMKGYRKNFGQAYDLVINKPEKVEKIRENFRKNPHNEKNKAEMDGANTAMLFIEKRKFDQAFKIPSANEAYDKRAADAKWNQRAAIGVIGFTAFATVALASIYWKEIKTGWNKSINYLKRKTGL